MAQPRELQIRGNVTIPPTQIERAAIRGARRFLLESDVSRARAREQFQPISVSWRVFSSGGTVGQL